MDIYVLEFPLYSPDLNIIENLWAILKAKLNDMYPDLEDEPKGEAERRRFIECAQAAWRAIPQDTIRKLFDSMPRRLAAVRKAKGW